MSTGTARLRAFVDSLPNDAIFARRQLVAEFGSRGVVDSVLQRLCAEHKIARVATGIYQRRAGASRMPTRREIIELRASVFGRQMIEPADSSANCTIFRIDGWRSSFRSIYGRLHFKPMTKPRGKRSLVKRTNRPVVLQPTVRPAQGRKLVTLFSLARRWFVRLTAYF